MEAYIVFALTGFWEARDASDGKTLCSKGDKLSAQIEAERLGYKLVR